MTLDNALRVAALVLFIIGALLAFNVFGDATVPQLLGLGLSGLACWCAAGVSLPRNAA